VAMPECADPVATVPVGFDHQVRCVRARHAGAAGELVSA
jgi:hypothetical protein